MSAVGSNASEEKFEGRRAKFFGDVLEKGICNVIKCCKYYAIAMILMCVSLAEATEEVSAPSVEWAKTYGGSEIEHLGSIQQTKDDGYIVVGSSRLDCHIRSLWRKIMNEDNFLFEGTIPTEKIDANTEITATIKKNIERALEYR
jgi:hypothetical protein